MMLPQRPYFPVGSLRGAIEYPSKEGAFTDRQISEALRAGRTAEAGGAARRAWRTGTARCRSANSSASGIARALLHAPQYLFLDEATASLDEPSEAALYRLLEEKLPATTIVSIGHRSTLDAFHQRNVALSREGDRFVLQDAGATVKSS